MNMIKIRHYDPARGTYTHEDSWININHIESIRRTGEFVVIRTSCREYFVDENTWRFVHDIMLCQDIDFKEGDAK